MKNTYFVKLLAELKAKGIKQQFVADSLAVSKSNISEIATGKNINPLFSTGDGIVQIHKEHCGSKSK